jgi:glycerophosphoryl diester phosphodiesterase
VKKCQAEKRVLISSFNHDYLAIAKTLCPLISTGALQEDEHPPDLVHYLQTLQVSAYHPANEIVDEQLVHQLRAAGFGVNVFTVNDRKRQLKLFSMGATAIFTDFPELSEPNIIPEIAI